MSSMLISYTLPVILSSLVFWYIEKTTKYIRGNCLFPRPESSWRILLDFLFWAILGRGNRQLENNINNCAPNPSVLYNCHSTISHAPLHLPAMVDWTHCTIIWWYTIARQVDELQIVKFFSVWMIFICLGHSWAQKYLCNENYLWFSLRIQQQTFTENAKIIF